jgi:pimeloyl-ACP methyl ester carboxylesterase
MSFMPKLQSKHHLPTPQTFQSSLGEVRYWRRSAPDKNAPTLLLLHGWPFNALSFRNLLPLLGPKFNCVLLDWPGLGASILDKGKADHINFLSLADLLLQFFDFLEESSLVIVAHDTGATIARLALARGASKASHLICLATEIPGHHLPLIPRLQKLFRIPFMPLVYVQLLKLPTVLRSSQGFAKCVTRLAHIDDDFANCFTRPLIADPRKRDGMIAYLNGIDWTIVSNLHQTQAAIMQPTAMIWGANDQIFPIELAREASTSFGGGCSFFEIPGGSFLALEESPRQVADAIEAFLG